MKRGSEDGKWETEAAMCAAFIAEIGRDTFSRQKKPAEWTAYPESCGWDILLVRNVDGFQIGIEAKLRMGLPVLNQAIESRHSYRGGPDCRAVLVPEHEDKGYGAICAYVGITIIKMAPPGARWSPKFRPYLPTPDHDGYFSEWFELCPLERHKLPEYVPDVAAGMPCPITLTTWKIRAIKLAVLLDRRGIVTRADFKHLALDHRYFTGRGAEVMTRGDGGWSRGPRFPDFKAIHPRNYEEIAADFEKWQPALVTAA